MRAKASTPGLDLAVVRDIVDTHASASTEPEGVTYAEVDADGVPALWAIPEGADPDKALLHFHFGGSVAASIHSDRKAAGHIAKAAGARSLVVGFRLAPEHPHPAQIDDAETAYRWLLAQGYEPRNIGSTGHSIGGTLAVVLPLRLLAKGEATPGAIVSVSPWTDLTISNPKVDENEELDKMLSRDILEQFRASLAAGPRRGLHRPRDQHRERRPDRAAAHDRPLRRVRVACRRRRRTSAADSPTSRSPPRSARCPRASTRSSSAPDACPRWTRRSSRWASGFAGTSAADVEAARTCASSAEKATEKITQKGG